MEEYPDLDESCVGRMFKLHKNKSYRDLSNKMNYTISTFNYDSKDICEVTFNEVRNTRYQFYVNNSKIQLLRRVVVEEDYIKNIKKLLESLEKRYGRVQTI